MKVIRLFFSLFFTMLLFTVSAQVDKKTDVQNDGQALKAAIYYFHMERRCMTCKTVEAESKKALEQLYPGEMDKGTVLFKSVNIEEADSKPLTDKYGIKGQTLLVVKGDKKKDLTSEGFLHAKSNPEKLKEEIEKAIKEM